MNSKRRFFLALLGLLMPGEIFADTGEAATTSPAPELSVKPYTFETRDGRSVEAEQGRFMVQENRRTRSEKEIELVFVRFPSTSKSPGAPIVYLAGGPGGSGIQTARGSRYDLFQSLRSVADVIAFDQRGTGDSHRLPPCSKAWGVPLEQPATRAMIDTAAEKGARFCAEEWRSKGLDLDAYNTEESADDLEDLRRALGAPKISLWTISYGTHLAMSTLRRHPESIDRVVLAGPEGPDHTVKHPRDGQEILEALAARVAENPKAQAAFPGWLGRLETLLAKLEKEPAKVQLPAAEGEAPVTMAVTAWDLRQLLAGALRGPETLVYLPASVEGMMKGDFGPLASYFHYGRGGEIWGMSMAMDCASGISSKRRREIRRVAPKTLLQDAINAPYEAMCRGLGVRDLGAAFRSPLRTSVPALFISGTFDGRTPVANSEELLPGFKHGSHLIVDGAGHSDPLFLSSPEIETWLLKFFSGASLPKEIKISVPFPPFLGI